MRILASGMPLLARIRRSLHRSAGRWTVSAALVLFFGALWNEGALCRCVMDGGSLMTSAGDAGAHGDMAMGGSHVVSSAGAPISGVDAIVASQAECAHAHDCCGCLGTCQGAGQPLPPGRTRLVRVDGTGRAEPPTRHETDLGRTTSRLIPPANPPPSLA